jgi:hypothetical protein
MSSFFEVVMVIRSGLLGHWNQQISLPQMVFKSGVSAYIKFHHQMSM